MKKLIKSSTVSSASARNRYDQRYEYNRAGQWFSVYTARENDPDTWEVYISEIHPYDDAPYHTAKITPNKVLVLYAANGDEVDRMKLPQYVEDDYERVEEYYDDLIDYACAELRNVNRNIEPKIIHN